MLHCLRAFEFSMVQCKGRWSDSLHDSLIAWMVSPMCTAQGHNIARLEAGTAVTGIAWPNLSYCSQMAW